MKKLVILLIMVFCSLPAFCLEKVQSKGEIYTGKVKTLADGLIIIESNGIETTFIKNTAMPDYQDYIVYRVSPIKKEVKSENCTVLFMDQYQIKFKTQSGVFELPRYRVTDLILNIN